MKNAIAITLLLTLVGCSKGTSEGATTAPSPAPESAGSDAPSEPTAGGRRMFLECSPESRGAEMCTMDYSPVCGQHADGKPAQTYPNVCSACKDPNVTGYFTGECETGANE